MTLGDAELVGRMEELARAEKNAVADLIEHLAEMDRRRLWKGTHGSLFEYCVFRLRMHPASACHRIRAARAFKAFPPVLNLLREGRLTLEAVVLLNPHLESHDAAELVSKATTLNHRQLESLLAARRPQDPKPDVVRFLGPQAQALPPAPDLPPSPPLLLEEPVPPPERLSSPALQPVRSSFTGDAELLSLVDHARSLLRHKHPAGRLESIIREALLCLLARKDRSWKDRA